MRHFLLTCTGIYELVRLAVVLRFRFSGPYWQWRMHTAFGPAAKPPPGRALHDTLEFARWLRRMRREM